MRSGRQDYPSGTTVEATLTSGSSAQVIDEGVLEDECTGSRLIGSTLNTGSTTETVSGKASALTWSGCTVATKTVRLGSCELYWSSGTDNGTLTVPEIEVTIDQLFGSCVYESGNGNDLGTLKGGNPASIKIVTTLTSGGGFGMRSGYDLECPVHVYSSNSVVHRRKLRLSETY